MFTYSFHSYKHIQPLLIDWEKEEFNVSYLAPSRAHWKLVTIQVRRTLVPELEKKYIICRSSVVLCCLEALSTADNLENFYKSHLKSGEWINGGHQLEVAESPSNQLCKKRQRLVQDGLWTGDESERERNSTPTSTDADTTTASTANIRPTPTVCQLRSGNAGTVRQIDLNNKPDLDDASFVSTAIKKFEAGVGRLQDHNAGVGRYIDFDTRICELRSKLSKTPDLEEAATGLWSLQKQTRGLAGSMGWKWEHLIRCIRILQRQRGCVSAMEDTDGVSARQEKSAFRINEVTNNLSKRIGTLALVVYSAFSAVNFTWSSVGRIDDAGRVNSIVDQVSNQVIDIGFRLPENITLFNPATTLSWLLGESYDGICKALGLGDLPVVDPAVGEGVFKETPLNSVMEKMNDLAAIPLRFWGEEKTWVLNGRLEDKIDHKRAAKKRKWTTDVIEPHEHLTQHETENGYVPMSPSPSQVAPLVYPRPHTHLLPTCMLRSHNTPERSMLESDDLRVIPSEVERTTITTIDRSEPGRLLSHAKFLQAGDVVEHSSWSSTESTSQEGNAIIHDAFMGSLVPSQDLLNIGSSYIREHWV